MDAKNLSTNLIEILKVTRKGLEEKADLQKLKLNKNSPQKEHQENYNKRKSNKKIQIVNKNNILVIVNNKNKIIINKVKINQITNLQNHQSKETSLKR